MKRLLFLPIIVFCFNAYSQEGWHWPEDPQTRKIAEENNIRLENLIRQKNFSAAKDPCYWLLSNCPDLHTSVYINAVKIYESLAESEPSKADIYKDSVILVHDLRIKYFDDQINVLERKAYYFYTYYKNKKNKYKEMLVLFSNIHKMKENEMNDYLVVSWLDIAKKSQKEFALAQSEVDLIYTKAKAVLNYKKSVSADPSKINKRIETLEYIYKSK